MPATVVITQLFAANKIIDAVTKVCSFSKANADVTRHAVFLPEDTTDEKSIWVIEEYASQTGLDAHMGSKPVKDMVAFFEANPTLFGGASKMSRAEVSAAFARPETARAKNPFVCHASIEYKPGKRAEALVAWKHVTSETEKNEFGTLSYSNYKDMDHAETVHTVEIYTNEQYFRDVHVPSKAVQENLKNYGNDIRVSIKHVILNFVGGYLASE